jgi:hypothetical protein
MPHHNCSGARSNVTHCQRSVNETQAKINQNREWLVSHPDDEAIKRRLQQLYAELSEKENFLSEAQDALENCEAQNETP